MKNNDLISKKEILKKLELLLRDMDDYPEKYNLGFESAPAAMFGVAMAQKTIEEYNMN